ncbi:MAG: glycosyltransferase [Staphylococcus equorum]
MIENKNLENTMPIQENDVPNFEDKSRIDQYQEILDEIDDLYNFSLQKINLMTAYKTNYAYYANVERESKLDFLKYHEEAIQNLPKSNGSRIYNIETFKVGMIADEFLFNSFKDVCNLVYLDDELTELDKDIDFIVIATTWQGIDKSWSGSASIMSPARKHLLECIDIIKEMDIPVIFYSKEDPVNYHLFKDVAAKCDIILTSAEEMIDLYKEYTNNSRVYAFQFGVNPHYHNPVGTRTKYSREHDNEVVFAGSWTEKYPIRNTEMERMFDGILEDNHELTIIDRNLPLKKERYQFPEKYIPYLTNPLPHDTLMDIHKIYRYAINVNSVKYSNTMFANRVFELQAFGNILLSNYSMGVNNQFPNVFMVNDKSDIAPMMNNYNEVMLNDLRAKSIRNVMRNHTTYDRLNTLANMVKLKIETKKIEILVICEEINEKIQEMFDRQLFIDATLVDIKQEDINYNQYKFFTYFHENLEYEEYYLEDLVTTFKYVDVDFVSKNNNKEIHNYTTSYEDIYKTMFDISLLGENWEIQKSSNGYNIDESEIFIKPFVEAKEKKISVIVPIYNNGTYLEDKCMRSLSRSSMFDNMEIIFVNDGSKDLETLNILNRLQRRFPNIQRFDFEKGSGSASRPRNKGVTLATTDVITYLDPDNEAIGDGYKELYNKLMENPKLDMVVGKIIKEDQTTRKNFNYFGTVKKYNNNNPLIKDTNKFMKTSGLRAQSIQALVVRKHVIEDNKIEMVEGAAGQDTIFFQELMLYSKQVLAINEFIHIYYAAVTNSVTNSVSKTLFEKYYTLELVRIPFLIKHDLMDTYMQERFNFYFKGWYLPRLEKVKEDERLEANKKFLEIYNLYNDFDKVKDQELEDYISSIKNN